MEEGGRQDGVLDGDPSPSLGVSVLGFPATDGLGELEASWQTPIPTFFPQSAPSSLPRGGSMDSIWKFGIQVVIKIIIIIKKSEET